MAAKPDPSAYRIGGISKAALSASEDDGHSDGPAISLADISKTFDHLDEMTKAAAQREAGRSSLGNLYSDLYPEPAAKTATLCSGKHKRGQRVSGSGTHPIEGGRSNLPADVELSLERLAACGEMRPEWARAHCRGASRGDCCWRCYAARDPMQRYRLSNDLSWRPTNDDVRLVTNLAEERRRRQSRG